MPSPLICMSHNVMIINYPMCAGMPIRGRMFGLYVSLPMTFWSVWCMFRTSSRAHYALNM